MNPRDPATTTFQQTLHRWIKLNSRSEFLVRLHLVALNTIAIWLAFLLLPFLPALPAWTLLVPLPLALLGKGTPFGARLRRFDREAGFGDLLCAAAQVKPDHPYAKALAQRAGQEMESRRLRLRRIARRPGRPPRIFGPLYGLLAMLLLFWWLMPIVPPWRSSLNIPSTRPTPTGNTGTGREQTEKERSAGRKPREQQNQPPSRPARPRPVEKVAFTPPEQGGGPRHKKKVYETTGTPPPPERRQAPQGPPRGREQRDTPENLKRSTEKALGAGLLTPGEAWVSRRLAGDQGR